MGLLVSALHRFQTFNAFSNLTSDGKWKILKYEYLKKGFNAYTISLFLVQSTILRTSHFTLVNHLNQIKRTFFSRIELPEFSEQGF